MVGKLFSESPDKQCPIYKGKEANERLQGHTVTPDLLVILCNYQPLKVSLIA